MTNQAEIDYEKQFQDDLAKATALSLEQQALDDYRRSKKYGTSTNTYYERSHSTQSDVNSYYTQLRNRHTTRGNSMTPPPLGASVLQTQRRHSEVSNANITVGNATTSKERSKTPPSSLPESDLISFASPTSKKPENATFEKLIEDLQKIQTSNSQTALVPLGPTAAAPIYPTYRTVTPAVIYRPQQYVPGPGGMQLVPFTPPTQQTKVPLTNEELQKLYNMPHPQTTAYPHAIGFIPPPGYYHSSVNYQQQSITQGPIPTPYLQAQQGYQYNTLLSSAGTSNYVAPVQSSNNLNQVNNFNVSNASNLNIPKISKSHSASSVSAPNGSAEISNTLRNQTPPARKQRTPNDLIDLSQEDDSRVSVLEAFDPLLNEESEAWKK